MVKILSENRFLFITWSFLLLLGCAFSAIHGKSGTHLLINNLHNNFLDPFMLIITNLGDGSVMVIIAIVLLFLKIRYSLILISSFLATSLFVQFLKKAVFPGLPRPVKFFNGTEISLHLVDGLKYHSYYSFPSGHAATAFALFIGLALIVKNHYLKYLFLLTACIVAFSRAYLSQHFLIDCLAGSVIGVSFALIFHYWFIRIDRKYLDLPIYKALGSK